MSRDVLPATLLLVLVLGCAAPLAAEEERTFTVLHTNDWHARLLGFGPGLEHTPETTGDDETRGGLARRATLLRRLRGERSGQEAVLVLDGGDFLSGSLFQALSLETGLELRFMGRLGYDAVSPGNHDFDYGPAGLARMLRVARDAGPVPTLLSANLRFAPTRPEDDALEACAADGLLRRHVVVERGGLRFGLFGLMGEHAAGLARFAAPVTFASPLDTAREMVALLRDEEQVDVVVALSHGGLLEVAPGVWDYGDVELAREVAGIDVVVSGHSHTRLEEPIVVEGRTIIVQAGACGTDLGELRVALRGGRPRVLTYRLHGIDDQIPGDPEVSAEVERLKGLVTARVLAPHGLSFDQPVAEVTRRLRRSPEHHLLANLVTDAVRAGACADVAFTGNGTIRDDLHLGKTGVQSVADVFRVVSLGVGHHQPGPGYPIIKAYLTGDELRRVAEVILLAHATKGDVFSPRISGARIVVNPYRPLLDRVVEIELGDPERGYRPIDVSGDDETLHSFACTTYAGRFLWRLDELSYGLLSVAPKAADGTPLTSPEEAIVDSDPAAPGVQEVKEWQALVALLRSFPDADGDGIADVPEGGARSSPRVVELPSLQPASLYRNATWILWSVTGAAGALLGGLLLVARAVHRRRAPRRLAVRPPSPLPRASREEGDAA